MMKVFAVRDSKADAFGELFACPSVGLAVRSFGEAVMNPKTGLNRYPEDYSLWELGTYEQNSGQVEGLKLPKLIKSAVEVIQENRAAETRLQPVLPLEAKAEEVA